MGVGYPFSFAKIKAVYRRWKYFDNVMPRTHDDKYDERINKHLAIFMEKTEREKEITRIPQFIDFIHSYWCLNKDYQYTIENYRKLIEEGE